MQQPVAQGVVRFALEVGAGELGDLGDGVGDVGGSRSRLCGWPGRSHPLGSRCDVPEARDMMADDS